MTTLVASDWHLSPESPPLHARLARAFLERAAAGGESVVLNGDVFEELYFGPRARAAHPEVVRAMDALARDGRLRTTRGNHDPGAGEERLALDVPGLGRVLVAHGDALDPLHASALGRLGDALSRRLGHLAVVRGAARLAEAAARGVADRRMREVFRRRCLAVVEREGFALGVFGHVHAPHLVPGDRYVNAGRLGPRTLGYVVLGPSGARLAELREDDLAARDGIAPEMG
ncbi:MAG TPA: metallophosphoesterase [Anaeromyxobacter sp.]